MGEVGHPDLKAAFGYVAGADKQPHAVLLTGVTRGKKLVVLVGQSRAIAVAVRNAAGRRRWSKLNEWLQAPTASGNLRQTRQVQSS